MWINIYAVVQFLMVFMAFDALSKNNLVREKHKKDDKAQFHEENSTEDFIVHNDGSMGLLLP